MEATKVLTPEDHSENLGFVPLSPERLDLMTNVTGNYRTSSLFYETNTKRDNYEPLFSLKPRDHKGYPSMKLLYLSYKDPTEFLPAMGILGSVKHWLVLTNAPFMKNHIQEWRDELEITLRAEGMRQIRAMSTRNDSTGFQAAKFLADKGWHKKETGGQTSYKRRKEQDKIQQALKTVDEDFARVVTNA